MARVKKCPDLTCGKNNPIGELFCEFCGRVLSDKDIIDLLEKPAQFNGIASEASRTSRENNRVVLIAELKFPWGTVNVDKHLAVGRDPVFSSIADHLSTHLTVSNRHAELTFDNSRLIVFHLSQTNPTYVNKQSLSTAGEKAVLADGDVVSFSCHMPAMVKLKPTK